MNEYEDVSEEGLDCLCRATVYDSPLARRRTGRGDSILSHLDPCEQRREFRKSLSVHGNSMSYEKPGPGQSTIHDGVQVDHSVVFLEGLASKPFLNAPNWLK